jgi:CheY-like chemotaxis protein
MKRILIADDKATSRELLRTVLERQGYLVTEAADGGEALEKAKADTLDLILLDLQMPVRTGYEVLGELRQDPSYAGLPVIALTASAMPGDREKALAAGFTAYIAKPVALAHLRAEVQRLLHADVSPPVDGAH